MWGKKVLSGEEGAHSDFFSGKKVLFNAFQWGRRLLKTLNGGRVKFFGILSEGKGFFKASKEGEVFICMSFFNI